MLFRNDQDNTKWQNGERRELNIDWVTTTGLVRLVNADKPGSSEKKQQLQEVETRTGCFLKTKSNPNANDLTHSKTRIKSQYLRGKNWLCHTCRNVYVRACHGCMIWLTVFYFNWIKDLYCISIVMYLYCVCFVWRVAALLQTFGITVLNVTISKISVLVDLVTVATAILQASSRCRQEMVMICF